MAKPLILCIDDEKSILDSLESQLQPEFGSEFTIELAESAEEAQEILKENLSRQVDIPLILADYLMPGCKGDQFLIWAHRKTPETRNVLLTGQAGLDAVVNAINNAGLYRYIAKPWERNDLILTVKEAVASFRQQKKIRLQNQDLHALNAQLEQMNQELDERVTIRTQELNQQKALFRQVFDNAPDPMAIVDDTEKIIQVNPAFLGMFQYTLSELQDNYLSDLIVAPESRPESTEFRVKTLAGQTIHEETQRLNKEGKSIPVSLMAYPLYIDTVSRGTIVVYQDLTLKRETADLLQRSYARHRRNDFFNALAASQKKISNDIYAQGQLLGVPLKSSFLLFFLMIKEWEIPFDLPKQDQGTGFHIFVDKMIDRLSEKPSIYAWDSQTGIGVLHIVSPDYHENIMTEKQIAEGLLIQSQEDFPKTKFVIGIAEFWPGMEHFAKRYKQARISALIGAKLHPTQNIHHYLETGAFPLLSKLMDDEESGRFLDRTIGKIIEYDRANGTNLFLTLEKIIAQDNLRKVADEMFLHYKTIIFRKQSIEKILGVSLDTFEGRTLVGTAMALYYFFQMEDDQALR
ncbi:MAG TPA: hypothetical protein DDW50_04680 [Firmicutes bacterium]|jgi:PAS domain S-box-containing protein|nr:hypothetical protein [Bacillota bacterium]